VACLAALGSGFIFRYILLHNRLPIKTWPEADTLLSSILVMHRTLQSATGAGSVADQERGGEAILLRPCLRQFLTPGT